MSTAISLISATGTVKAMDREERIRSTAGEPRLLLGEILSIKAAARMGDVKSQMQLGKIYETGKGLKKN